MLVLWALLPVATVAWIVYQLFFHTLSHIKGPRRAIVSPIFLWLICYLGIEGRILRYYHLKYNTKVLRIAPNAVSISDSRAIHDIYVRNGGFAKDDRYANFNMGDVVTIFSATDIAYRNRRAKAVAPLFAPARLREASEAGGVIGDCVQDFVKQLRSFKDATKQVDILDMCARLSIDVVTAYLLGEEYGGLSEGADLPMDIRQGRKLSANPFVFAIVTFARFSLLPGWLFRSVYAISSWLSSSEEVALSLERLDRFASHVMVKVQQNGKDSSQYETTYQGRLLKSGIPEAEAVTQGQATIFAGADSTAVMLATTLFHLVQNPAIVARLAEEIRQDGTSATSGNESLLDNGTPLLRAVIKEGLRLGMANPTRLTRVVPSTGLQIGDVFIPAGTVVGCAAYLLHHDPDIFPSPFEFVPDRWLRNETNTPELSRLSMDRNMMPFGIGLRACIGKNLAQQQLLVAVMAVIESDVLEGARTIQDRIEVTEWFNGEIKDHCLDLSWM